MMKRMLCILVLFAILTAPLGATAQANWWNDIGPSAKTQTPEPTPEPTKAPKLDLGSLFGGLMGADKTEPDPTGEPEPIEEPDPEVTVEPGAEDEPGMLDGDLVPEDNHEHTDDDIDRAFWENVLFGLEVGDITARPYGGAVEYARIGKWNVGYGVCDDHYCIYGWNGYTQEYRILAETVVSEFVTTKDGFAYYGEVKSGKFGWMFRDPDEATPVSLGLNELNSVFWSDETYFYYFEYGSGTAVTYYRMEHDGKNKKKLGKLNGRAVAQMMDDGAAVVFNTGKNRVQLWKDGEHTTIYDPKDEILNVISTGQSIWVDHRDYFGRLNIEKGEIDFRFDGTLRSYAMTHDQVFAIVDDGAMRLDVRMLNDLYQAYAVVGQMYAQDGLTIEIRPGGVNSLVVWGPRESLEFYTPYPDQFLPYGFYDMETAKANGFVGWVGYDGDPGDIPAGEWRAPDITQEGSGAAPADDTGDAPYAGGGQVERRVPDGLMLSDEAAVLQEAEQYGITVTHEDGVYAYRMDEDAHQALLGAWKANLNTMLGNLMTLGDSGSVTAFTASDDFGAITLKVDSARFSEDMSTLITLALLSSSAPAYQALLSGDENPKTAIRIVDAKTGNQLANLTAPDDFAS